MPFCQNCHNLIEADGVCPSCLPAVPNAGTPQQGPEQENRPSRSGGLFGGLSAAGQRKGANIAKSYRDTSPNPLVDRLFGSGLESGSTSPSVARPETRRWTAYGYVAVWPSHLRIFSGAVALWSAVQVGFLAVAYSGSAATPTAELVATHNDAQYLTSMAFHSLAVLVFLCGAILPTATWIGLKEIFARISDDESQDVMGRIPNLCLYLFAFGLFVVFVVSIWEPRYEVYIDLQSEQIVRRDTHLQPPGVTYDIVDFQDIKSVRGEINGHSHNRDNGPDKIEFHSVIRIVTTEGREIEVGREFPAQSSSRFAPEARSLARTIAEKSGARLLVR